MTTIIHRQAPRNGLPHRLGQKRPLRDRQRRKDDEKARILEDVVRQTVHECRWAAQFNQLAQT